MRISHKSLKNQGRFKNFKNGEWKSWSERNAQTQESEQQQQQQQQQEEEQEQEQEEEEGTRR